jgi:imidazolonepropionase-like amidohydrolase
VFRKAQEFEVAFVRAGGLLAAGVDPTGNGGALPGFGDQRNYELLIEAGFAPVEAIRILTANGAKVLGIDDRLGTIAAGKIADLVVIKGDPIAQPAEIRNVVTVFKDGVGYDSAKLVESVKGVVGVR